MRTFKEESWPRENGAAPALFSRLTQPGDDGLGGSYGLLLRRIDPPWIVADERPSTAVLRVPAELLEAEGAIVMLDDIDTPVDLIVVQAPDDVRRHSTPMPA